MRRYLIRGRDGQLTWTTDPPRQGERLVCEVPERCPACRTRGGLTVFQSGQVNCAACQRLLRPQDRR